MKKRLEKFYASFGDKGVMFCIYALSLVLNSLFTISSELPSVLTEEISSAGVSAFYSGRDWSALLCDLGIDGYIQQIIYAPLFRVVSTPYALYKAMLVENAVIISFIPIIAYHLAGKTGIVRVRGKLICSLTSGLHAAYIAGSKLICNNVLAGLLTWILAWCIFAAWDKKNKYTRFVTSLATGFLCALGYAADKRMLVTAAAVVITAIVAKCCFNERIFNIPVLFGSLAVSFVTEHFARLLVLNSAAGISASENISLIPEKAGGGFWGRFFGESYAFLTGSTGIGAIAMAAFGTILAVYIKERIKNKPEILDGDTKVYESIKHRYSIRIMVFGLFQCLTVLISVTAFSVFSFCGESAGFSEICMGLDNIIPLSVFFALAFLVAYGSDLHKLFISVGVYSLICAGFSITYYKSGAFLKSGKIAAVLPFRFGEGVTEELTGMSFIIMSSCVFTVFSLLIVFTACTKKRFMKFMTAAMYALLIYSTAYVGFQYLPETARATAEYTASYRAVSELLYNDEQSPQIIVAYDSSRSRELAGMIQFMNFNTSVYVMKNGDKVPESCLLVAENGITPPFDGGSYDVVTKTGEYTVYAYGESARDFIRYSSVAS